MSMTHSFGRESAEMEPAMQAAKVNAIAMMKARVRRLYLLKHKTHSKLDAVIPMACIGRESGARESINSAKGATHRPRTATALVAMSTFFEAKRVQKNLGTASAMV